jgi:G3E family GTPase
MNPLNMLRNIPTHVIAGPLGAGKTSLIRHLMTQRPEGERWAVLINEFGQIGLDAALLDTAEEGIAIGEVAGGCLCCVNGAPFQIGLGRLLRRAQPHRLFIEPSGLGHPVELLKQLDAAPWQGVLTLQPLVMVLDAQAMACGQLLSASQQSAMQVAGLIILNKADNLPVDKRVWISSRLPSTSINWTEEGRVFIDALPSREQALAISDTRTLGRLRPADRLRPASETYPQADENNAVVREINPQPEAWSIGWRWPRAELFELGKIEQWISRLSWKRAKLIIHSPEGWQSLNAVDNIIPMWKSSEWRKDSRLELIFAQPQDIAALEAGMQSTRISACRRDGSS